MDVGDEGPEAVGLAVAFEVESEAGETLLGEENWGGLEGPADVVAVAVDHEDEATWRGEEGQPLPGEELEAPGRGVEGFGGFDALEIVVFLLWGVAPVVQKLGLGGHEAFFFLHSGKWLFCLLCFKICGSHLELEEADDSTRWMKDGLDRKSVV